MRRAKRYTCSISKLPLAQSQCPTCERYEHLLPRTASRHSPPHTLVARDCRQK
ncbi:hypothetical protein C8R44DRAFT_803874 [Mycena epipterygia]|nr:hypothetical protein C8R44DRAFT_803874 [Mycena epipterygia]